MLGDTSAKGLEQSYGLMVNYLYDPRLIERNHEAYAERDEVIASAAGPPVAARRSRQAAAGAGRHHPGAAPRPSWSRRPARTSRSDRSPARRTLNLRHHNQG